MTTNVLLVGRKSYLASQLIKRKWATYQLFDPALISPSAPQEWNRFEQTLKFQEIVLYLHHPSRKDFEIGSTDYINSALTTAKDILTRVESLSNAKVIFIGSYWQESSGTSDKPLNNYTSAKQLVEEYIASTFKGDCRGASLHLADVYGPNDFRNKLIPTLIENWKFGRLTRINNSSAPFAPIHVDDVVEAIRIEALETNITSFHIHSISPEQIFTVKDFVQTFIQIFPEAKIEFDAGQNSDSIMEYSAHSFPGEWSPKIDLRTGLQELRKLNR
jgi:nucleoside-diphosphate-sugar epimerase